MLEKRIMKTITFLVNIYVYERVTEDEKDYITSFKPNTAKFYGLPKIYKSKQVQQEVITQRSKNIVLEI